MARKRRKIPFWIHYSNDELLDLRFKDLKINLAESSLKYFVGQLHDELEQRNINFKPHCWLSDEWFSPDTVPGIAIPFYLSHPKLTKFEAKQVYAVEGGADRACMQYLRHEAGHTICTAYQLYRRNKLFGDFNKPHPKNLQA
jgi:hypothetical protein